MSLAVTNNSPVVSFPAGVPVTLAALRRIAQFTTNISGAASTAQLGDGTVTAAETVPDAHFYAAGTLSGGVYSVPLSPALTSYAAGKMFAFKADLENSAGAVNVNVNGLGSIDLLMPNGSELEANYIGAGSIVECRLQSATTAMVLSVGKPTLIRAGTAGGSANALSITLTPATLTLSKLQNVAIEFIVASTNTATPVTLEIVPSGAPALTAKNITKRGASALDVGDLIAGMICRVVYDGTQFQLITPTGAAPTDVAIIGEGRNIVMQNGSPAVSRISITAAEIVLKTASGANYLASGVSTYCDFATGNGALGLDTGAEASSTWYYVWLIYAPSSGTIAGLFSTSSTSPTMPAEFTFKALIGAVYNGSGSDLITVFQHDRRCNTTEIALFTNQAAAVADTYESIALTAFVPPIARRVYGVGGSSSTAQAARLSISPDTAETGACRIMGGQNGTAYSNFTFAGQWEVPLMSTQLMYWKSGTTSASNRICICGWVIQ